jgi:flagellar motor switch protein FliG
MALSGKQKAAMLLMSLDAVTVNELLKDMDPDKVQELAIEVATLDASGMRNNKEQIKITQEFCNSLKSNKVQGLNVSTFLNEMLVNILGKTRAEDIRLQVKEATVNSDLFAGIRAASSDQLVLAMDGEHPQTVAAVLSELSSEMSQEILSLLPDDVRGKTVWKLTNPDALGSGVKQRIAIMITERIRKLKGETLVAKPGRRDENLRKLAIVLSGLEKDLRDQLIEEIEKQDDETGKKIRILMITWEDIINIADRSMQECLRSVESNVLAIALYNADEDIVEKIRSNISERALGILDEEISMMQDPLDKELFEAREEVVKPLRDANEEGKLRMESR